MGFDKSGGTITVARHAAPFLWPYFMLLMKEPAFPRSSLGGGPRLGRNEPYTRLNMSH